jgi:hypothetical protein
MWKNGETVLLILCKVPGVPQIVVSRQVGKSTVNLLKFLKGAVNVKKVGKTPV